MSANNPKPSCLELTANQERADKELEQELLEKCVLPLMERMREAVPEWPSMDAVGRFQSLAHLNVEHLGEGECLPVICPHYELAWFQAYSGKAVSVDWWASKGETGGVLPLQFSEHSATPITHGARFIVESDDFGTLPPAFQVASIAEFVLEHAVTGYTEAFAFAMGCSELVTFRAGIAPKMAFATEACKERRVEGWTIHVRDARPSNEMMLEIARRIRNYDALVADPGIKVPYARDLTTIQEEPDHRKSRRSGNSDLKRLIDAVDDLIERGIDPRRGGNSSWKDVWRRIYDESPSLLDDHRTSESLMQSYSQYKRRHGK